MLIPKPETSNTKPEITSPVVASQPVENLPGTSSLKQFHDQSIQPAKLSNFLNSLSNLFKFNKMKHFKLIPNIKLPDIFNRFRLKPIKNKPESDPGNSGTVKDSYISIPSLDSFTNISTLNLISKSSKINIENVGGTGDFKSVLVRKINPIFPIVTDSSQENSPTFNKVGVELTQNYYRDEIFQSTSTIDTDHVRNSRNFVHAKVRFCNDTKNKSVNKARSVENCVQRDVSSLRRIRSSNSIYQEDINWVQFVSNMNKILSHKISQSNEYISK